MAIAKLLLLLVMGIGRDYVATAPNARPPAEQLRELRGLERAMPHIAVFGRVLVLAQPILQLLLPTSVDPAALTTLTPTFLAGAVLLLCGTVLRGYCFHTLGPRFTFELSIRPSHALVTDGVYSIVRHPSYTGAISLSVGWLLWMLDRRSVCVGLVWAATRGGSVRGSGDEGSGLSGDVVTAFLACTWITMMGPLCLLLVKRMDKEDAMLEQNFGDEWRAWTKKVPYRLLPGVY
ncbi:hypothetical protein JVU11DRAFT_8801 [Chiua virens]|nr:hypothetical protein JVU11DRAFT_8801 [Chiua virens]